MENKFKTWLNQLPEGLDTLVSHELISLGVSPQFVGYTYLKTAVELCCIDSNVRQQMREQVYSIVGDLFNIPSSVILQAIRRCVVDAWEGNKTNTHREIVFPHKTDSTPFALEFIAILSDFVLGVMNSGERKD